MLDFSRRLLVEEKIHRLKSIAGARVAGPLKVSYPTSVASFPIPTLTPSVVDFCDTNDDPTNNCRKKLFHRRICRPYRLLDLPELLPQVKLPTLIRLTNSHDFHAHRPASPWLQTRHITYRARRKKKNITPKTNKRETGHIHNHKLNHK